MEILKNHLWTIGLMLSIVTLGGALIGIVVLLISIPKIMGITILCVVSYAVMYYLTKSIREDFGW